MTLILLQFSSLSGEGEYQFKTVEFECRQNIDKTFMEKIEYFEILIYFQKKKNHKIDLKL